MQLLSDNPDHESWDTTKSWSGESD
jgi:hypothetical protein